ncbi:hypothetical protein PR048_002709 [Dryococelus australis]|uniref:Uncharacterized protein n=1 Tax=Dryococelus australis TaxID=614101 RepID=A0ABQ9IL02_9NEOP|nr:hypothetical protein PR048_002709 [Dryococelus australis]
MAMLDFNVLRPQPQLPSVIGRVSTSVLFRTLFACSMHGAWPPDALMATTMSQYSLRVSSMASSALLNWARIPCLCVDNSFNRRLRFFIGDSVKQYKVGCQAGTQLANSWHAPATIAGPEVAPLTSRTMHITGSRVVNTNGPKAYGSCAVSLLASHQGDPGSIPGRVTPDFRM